MNCTAAVGNPQKRINSRCGTFPRNNKAKRGVVKVVGIDSEEESEGEDEDDDAKEEEPSIFTDMTDSKFHNEVNETLRHMTLPTKKPPPSIKPDTSATTKSASKYV
jgi:hypothetical protein